MKNTILRLEEALKQDNAVAVRSYIEDFDYQTLQYLLAVGRQCGATKATQTLFQALQPQILALVKTDPPLARNLLPDYASLINGGRLVLSCNTEEITLTSSNLLDIQIAVGMFNTFNFIQSILPGTLKQTITMRITDAKIKQFIEGLGYINHYIKPNISDAVKIEFYNRLNAIEID